MARYRVMKAFNANRLYYPIGAVVDEYLFSLPVLRALESSGKIKIIETTMHLPSHLLAKTITQRDIDIAVQEVLMDEEDDSRK